LSNIILDVCVGPEKIYSGMNKKLGDNFVSIDIRKGVFSFKNDSQITENVVIVKPTVVANMRSLPFSDSSISKIICDPPHMVCGKTGFGYRLWGSWDIDERINTLGDINEEFNRVLSDGGTLIIKIIPEQFYLFEELLTNFIFFLPIHTVGQHGCINTKESKKAAIWYIGCKK
jgi:hypothetical protein